MKPPTFEEYLEERHTELFPTVLDDDMPDHFDNWVGSLDADEVMRYAEDAVPKAFFAGFDHAKFIAFDAITYKPRT